MENAELHQLLAERKRYIAAIEAYDTEIAELKDKLIRRIEAKEGHVKSLDIIDKALEETYRHSH